MHEEIFEKSKCSNTLIGLELAIVYGVKQAKNDFITEIKKDFQTKNINNKIVKISNNGQIQYTQDRSFCIIESYEELSAYFFSRYREVRPANNSFVDEFYIYAPELFNKFIEKAIKIK